VYPVKIKRLVISIIVLNALVNKNHEARVANNQAKTPSTNP
jgi:hypothetical protein